MDPDALEQLGKEVAYQVYRGRRQFPWMDRAGMESAAWCGAAQAIQSHRPGSASLRTFAKFRIRGQIQDDAASEWRYRSRETALVDRFTIPAQAESIDARLTIAKLLTTVHLQPRYRDLIRLRYFEDRTHPEIALIFGVHPTHVSRMLRLAHRKLREAA